MGLFEAEKRSKTKEEDILTSRVFGILEITDKVLVLGKMLETMKIHLSDEELREAKIKLWESMNSSIPDAIIESPSTLIFVESKLDSPISKEQLKREYEDGFERKQDFHLICVTSHFDLPEEIEELRKDIPQDKLHWISWRDIYKILNRVKGNPELCKTAQRLLGDLITLLESKDLKDFTGFKPESLKVIVNSYGAFESFMRDMALFIESLSSRLLDANIKQEVSKGTSFWRDGRGTSLSYVEGWITHFFTIVYADQDWTYKLPAWYHGFHLFVRVYLNEETNPIWVGYHIRTKRRELYEKTNELYQFLKNNQDMSVCLMKAWWKPYSDYELLDAQEITADHFKEENLRENYECVELFYKIPLEEISSGQLVEKVASKVKILRDEINRLGFQPKEFLREEEMPEEILREEEMPEEILREEEMPEEILREEEMPEED